MLAVALCSGSAWAKTRTAPVGVTASVTANCRLNSPVALALGTYGSSNAGGKALVGNGKVLSISCTKNAPAVRIALNNGTHFSNSKRHVAGPNSKKVAYQIYTGSNLKTVWNSSNTVAYTPRSSAATSISMYSKVPGGQKPPPGQYSDTLTATVNF